MRRRRPSLEAAFIGFVALATAIGVGRFAFTPFLPMMRDEGVIEIADGGLLASVHYPGYAMGAVLARYVQLPARTTVGLSLSLIACASLAMDLTTDFTLWGVSRWTAGAASALVLIAVSNQVMSYLTAAGREDLRGEVFAGVGGGILAVGLLALLLMVLEMSSDVGWRVCAIAAFMVASFGYWRWPSATGEPNSAAQQASAIPSRIRWRIVAPYGAMGFGYIIPATYLPIMAQNAIASPLVFGWSWPAFGLMAAISTVLAVRLGRRLPDRRIWVAAQMLMAAGLCLPALWHSLLSVMVGGMCVGATFMVVTMVGIKEAHRLSPPGGAQGQIAVMTAAFAVGQMAGPFAAGLLYDATASFTSPLLLASAALALTCLALSRPKPPDRSASS